MIKILFLLGLLVMALATENTSQTDEVSKLKELLRPIRLMQGKTTDPPISCQPWPGCQCAPYYPPQTFPDCTEWFPVEGGWREPDYPYTYGRAAFAASDDSSEVATCQPWPTCQCLPNYPPSTFPDCLAWISSAGSN